MIPHRKFSGVSMSDHYRTFIHKDCDKQVFGQLFSRNPYYRRLGEEEHAFFTGINSELVNVSYEHKDLTGFNWTGQQLYDYRNTEILLNDYRGAIEVTEEQAGLIFDYNRSIMTEEPEL